MHWAAHRHTAAEIVYQRADAEKENMGLTSWEGKRIKRSDTEIAKNYLTQTELDALNKIVSAYLDIAEVRALAHEPMYMKDRQLIKRTQSMKNIEKSRMNYCLLLSVNLSRVLKNWRHWSN